MSRFDEAIQVVLKHEGLLANHANDPGGITNYGVSLRFLQQTGDFDIDGWKDGDINRDGRIDPEDVKMLSREKAIEIYRLYFWEPNQYDRITHQFIADKVFDLCVNMSPKAAHRIVQRAIRAVTGDQIKDDGILGKISFSAINNCDPLLLNVAIKVEAAAYYRSLVEKNNKLSVFLNGWLNRAYS